MRKEKTKAKQGINGSDEMNSLDTVDGEQWNSRKQTLLKILAEIENKTMILDIRHIY